MNTSNIDNTSFENLYNKYYQYINLKKKPQSLRTELNTFKIHILPYFKGYKLKEINADVYLDFLTSIKNKGFKASYNNTIHLYVSSILDFACKYYGLKNNIAKQIGGFSTKKEKNNKYDIWTLEDFQTFISVVDNKIHRLIYITLFFTGLRIGELMALTWNDINFKESYIDINKTIAKETDANGNRIINSPKTPSSIRIVKIDNTLLNLFIDYYEEQKQIHNFNDNWFIFGGSKPYSQSTISRNKDKYCKIANIKKIRLHDFRHSHATLLIAHGTPITNVSKRLGHSNVYTTLNTYSHYIELYDNSIDLLGSLHDTLKY